MNYLYTCPKKIFNNKNIEHIVLHFNNGDLCTIDKKEINKLLINTNDKLILVNDCISYVALQTYIKLELNNYKNGYNLVYNEKKFRNNRKIYIEERCVNENDIFSLELIYEDYKHYIIYGNFKANLDERFLYIKNIYDEKQISNKSHEHSIYLRNVSKSIVRRINLTFEPCVEYSFEDNEIIDLQFNFESKLNRDYKLTRVVKNGFIVLNLNTDYIDYVYDPDNQICLKKKSYFKKFENCILYKKNEGNHDITNITISYDAYGSEELTIKNLYDDDDTFIGGQCKKLKNGYLLITFSNKPINEYKIIDRY